VLHADLGVARDSEALPRDLDAERLPALQRVGQATQLRGEFLDGVITFDISISHGADPFTPPGGARRW
jgi:hypothetical protein